MPRIVFFDIDGTLVDSCNEIPASAKEAILSLRQKGILTGISTGRCPSELRDFTSSHPDLLFDVFVYANGALAEYKGETIVNRTLPRAELAALLQIAQDNNIPYWTSDKHNWYYSLPDLTPIAHILLPQESRRTDFFAPAHHLTHDVYMGELYMETAQLALFQDTLDSLEIVPGMLVGGKEGPMMDFWRKDTNKATGVLECLKMLHITPEEVVAVGDSFNDIPIIELAGIGVAMGNASEEVKQAADYVTKSLEDDGIAYCLQQLQLI